MKNINFDENVNEEQNLLIQKSNNRFSPIVITDEQRVMQVLLNLQSNALKFTRVGSVTISVEMVQQQEAKYLRLSVTDTGVGIPYEDQDKLFKLFGFVQSTQ